MIQQQKPIIVKLMETPHDPTGLADVLIGAGMPSVLAEISFVTHKQEGQLLKTNAYRQQIAEALQDAVLRYQQSLKNRKSIATKGTGTE